MCNVLQFIKQFFSICIILHVTCCLLYIYIYVCCISECGTRLERSTLYREWYWNERSLRSYVPPPPPLSLSTATYCCIHATKGVEQKVSTMYFYRTAYRQYVHSGSDTHIHYWLAIGESILLLLWLNVCC